MKILLFSTILIILFGFTYQDKKQTTTRWGLIGDKNSMVVDETEILVVEWLEYIYYNDLETFDVYVENPSVKKKHLTQEQKQLLLKHKIEKRFLPERTLLEKSKYICLFSNSKNKTLLEFRDGLKGNIVIPVDEILYKRHVNAGICDLSIKQLLLLPITGITYEQALGFIKWRNELEELRKEFHLENYGTLDKWIEFYTFDLPTKKQHQLFNFEKDSLAMSKSKEYSTFNYRNCTRVSKTEYPFSGYGYEAVVPYFKLANNIPYDFKKSEFSGMKHVQGNVAEMTKTKGEAMGGSFHHYAIESYKDTVNRYIKAEPWLGFRCIGERITN